MQPPCLLRKAGKIQVDGEMLVADPKRDAASRRECRLMIGPESGGTSFPSRAGLTWPRLVRETSIVCVVWWRAAALRDQLANCPLAAGAGLLVVD
jgi:hypothetical protein